MKIVLLPLLLLISTSCTPPTAPQSIRWSNSDLDEMSHKMVQNMLRSSAIKCSNKNIYYFAPIRNDTHDQIETNLLKHRIISLLTQGKKFNITEKKEQASLYTIRGKISSIFKKNNQEKDIFFHFNLSITENHSSLLIYSHDIEIRKHLTRPLLSW